MRVSWAHTSRLRSFRRPKLWHDGVALGASRPRLLIFPSGCGYGVGTKGRKIGMDASTTQVAAEYPISSAFAVSDYIKSQDNETSRCYTRWDSPVKSSNRAKFVSFKLPIPSAPTLPSSSPFDQVYRLYYRGPFPAASIVSQQIFEFNTDLRVATN